MPLSPRLSLLASTSIVSPWLLSFWIIHYFINLLNSLISMRDGCSQPPETIPISQDLLFLSCDKSTIHSSDVDLWWYWLPLWGSTSNRSFQLWEEDTRDWLNSVQNFIIITIPEHSGSWTRAWCNQSLCSLQYTCRGTIEYSYQISSIVSGSRGVNEYSLWLHSSAGPRSAAIRTPRNLKLLRLSTTVYQWLWILGFPLLKSTIHYLVLLTLWAKVLFCHHSFRLSISLRYSDSLLPNIQPTTVVSSANLKDGNGVMSCYSHVYRVEQGTKHTASSIWWLMRRTFCKLVVIGVCWWGSQGRRGTQYSKFW